MHITWNDEAPPVELNWRESDGPRVQLPQRKGLGSRLFATGQASFVDVQYEPSPTNFTIAAGIWLVVTQWISALFGGYIAGRLRTRWHSLHTHEVFFRDTAHGLLTWAVATIIVTSLALLSGALSGLVIAPADATLTPEAVDAARKATSTFSLFTAIATIVGAFIACVSASLGGHLRDNHP